MGAAASTNRRKSELEAEQKRLHEEEEARAATQRAELEYARQQEQERRENELTPEQKELFEVSVEVHDSGFIASESVSDLHKTSDFQFLPNSDYIHDTFITSSGKAYTCFKDASRKWFYIDWNKQNQPPLPVPESWIRDGGYFLNESRKKQDREQTHYDEGLVIDLPHLHDSFFTSATRLYDPTMNRYVAWQMLPSIRPVRHMYDGTTGCWSLMPLSLELTIPEVKQTITFIERKLNRARSANSIEIPTRTEILQALRGCAYDVDRTLKMFCVERLPSCESDTEIGYWESRAKSDDELDLEQIADHHDKHKGDSAISLVDLKSSASQRLFNVTKWKLSDLDAKLEIANKEIRKLILENTQLEDELASLRLDLAQQRDENGQRDQALIEANAQLFEQNDVIKALRNEVESLRMLRLDMLPELPSKVIEQKDMKIRGLTATILNLKMRLAELEEWRRRFGVSAVRNLNQLRKLRIEHQRYKSEVKESLDTMFKECSRMMVPLVEKVFQTETTNQSLQNMVQVSQRSGRYLKNLIHNLRGGIEVVCRMTGSNMIGDPSVRLLGERCVVAKNKTDDVEVTFDQIFTSSSSEDEFYAKSMKQYVSGCLDGLNFSVLFLSSGNSRRHSVLYGEGGRRGIIAMAITTLLDSVGENKQISKAAVTISCIEIHREKAYDLLSKLETSLNTSTIKSNLHIKPEPSSIVLESMETLSKIQQAIENKAERIRLLYSYSSSFSSRIYIISISVSLNSSKSLSSRLVFVDMPSSPANLNLVGPQTVSLPMLQEYLSVKHSLAALSDEFGKQTGKIKYSEARNSLLMNILTSEKYGRMCIRHESLEDGEMGKTLLIAGMNPNDFEESFSTLSFFKRIK